MIMVDKDLTQHFKDMNKISVLNKSNLKIHNNWYKIHHQIKMRLVKQFVKSIPLII